MMIKAISEGKKRTNTEKTHKCIIMYFDGNFSCIVVF